MLSHLSNVFVQSLGTARVGCLQTLHMLPGFTPLSHYLNTQQYSLPRHYDTHCSSTGVLTHRCFINQINILLLASLLEQRSEQSLYCKKIRRAAVDAYIFYHICSGRNLVFDLISPKIAQPPITH